MANEILAISLFEAYDQPTIEPKTVSLDQLVGLLTTFEVLDDKYAGRCWSPARYVDGVGSRSNAGVSEVSALVFDLDRVPPDNWRLGDVCRINHTTWSHRPDAPKWRLIVPLTTPVAPADWPATWRRARGALCPEADPQCKDPSRQYFLPSRPPGGMQDAAYRPGELLDPSTLPDQVSGPSHQEMVRLETVRNLRPPTDNDRRRGAAYLAKVVGNLEATGPGERNAALNRAAWTLGRWIAPGALDQAEVEDRLYNAAMHISLVADDGPRQCWSTIRSGLGAGLQAPVDLAASNRPQV
jgi:hypothetical protein